MTVTTVRVQRTYQQTVTEFVDIDVTHDDDARDFSVEKNAKMLVEAQTECGHHVGWHTVSATMKDYPGPIIEANILRDDNLDVTQPPPVAPAPLPEPQPAEDDDNPCRFTKTQGTKQ